MAAILGMVIAGFCALNLVRIFSSHSRGPRESSDLFTTQSLFKKRLEMTLQHPARHANSLVHVPGVYPYSVVPGGLRDAGALRTAVAGDRAVARHFSHFDFANARLERIGEHREVYVSYRIRDTIFWTRKKVLSARGTS